MDWIFLIIAGIFEMTGVAMINKFHLERNGKSLFLMLATFTLSFLFLALAMKTLPMGTAYAVWTGIGASGGAVTGMLIYGEPRDRARLAAITIVLISTIGLKLIG